MTLNRRLLLVPLCLSAAFAAQCLLQWHLDAGQTVYPELRAPLASVPLSLETDAPGYSAGNRDTPTAWRGIEHPQRAAVGAQIPFADEFLFRAYTPKSGGPLVEVYVVHSRSGEDRKHHPEICVREAAGKTEENAARRVVYLEDQTDRPVQRFRFRNPSGAGQPVVFYYWHYTFPPAENDTDSFAQKLHRRLSHSPPSVTVQVSTEAAGEELELIERSFLPALDARLKQGPLPAGTVMGCDRAPVTLVRQ